MSREALLAQTLTSIGSGQVGVADAVASEQSPVAVDVSDGVGFATLVELLDDSVLGLLHPLADRGSGEAVGAGGHDGVGRHRCTLATEPLDLTGDGYATLPQSGAGVDLVVREVSTTGNGSSRHPDLDLPVRSDGLRLRAEAAPSTNPDSLSPSTRGTRPSTMRASVNCSCASHSRYPSVILARWMYQRILIRTFASLR